MKKLLSLLLSMTLALGTMSGLASAMVDGGGGGSSVAGTSGGGGSLDEPALPKFPKKVQMGIIVVAPSPAYYQQVTATAAAQPVAALADAANAVWKTVKWAVITVAGDRLVKEVDKLTGGGSNSSSPGNNASKNSTTNNKAQ